MSLPDMLLNRLLCGGGFVALCKDRQEIDYEGYHRQAIAPDKPIIFPASDADRNVTDLGLCETETGPILFFFRFRLDFPAGSEHRFMFGKAE